MKLITTKTITHWVPFFYLESTIWLSVYTQLLLRHSHSSQKIFCISASMLYWMIKSIERKFVKQTSSINFRWNEHTYTRGHWFISLTGSKLKKKQPPGKMNTYFPFFLLSDVHLGAAQKYQQKQGFVTYVC